jgi:hypothetical protein
MAEILVLLVFIGVFVKKVNQIKLLHVEWGLFRLEFEPEQKKTLRNTARKLSSVKEPKQLRSGRYLDSSKKSRVS